MLASKPIRIVLALASLLLLAVVAFAAPASAGNADGGDCAALTARVAHSSSTNASAQAKHRAALRRCMARTRRVNLRQRQRRQPDTTAPTVAWKAPAGGSTVHGYLGGSACEVTASDDRGVSQVVFQVDGKPVHTEYGVPYNCEIDSTGLADGKHTLTATAYDGAGNSTSASVAVTVSNSLPAPAPGPAPAPAPEPQPTPATPEPAPEPTPAPEPGSAPLAIGIDGGYGGWWSEEVEFRKALNAPVTRHEWDPGEPVNAQDSLVLKATTEVHTRFHALLGGNTLGDATHYREWVVAFIRRYGVGGSFWSEHPTLDASRYAITTFELGNEPYFGAMSAAEYADTVRPALEAVHQLGLPAKLILPSYIYGADTSWIDTLYQRIPNLNSLFYGFADHPYWYGHAPSQGGDGNSPFQRIERLRQQMAAHGASSKPIFLTEYGESTASCGSECVSEAVQAVHINEMIEAAVHKTEWKVELLCLYQLHDWSTNSTGREQQFGLLRQNGTQKPSYAIARAAMQLYRG